MSFSAAADAVVALVVALGDVAGQEPAVAERGRRRLVVAPVAGEDVRPAHEQLALLREVALDVRVRLAGPAGLAARVLGRRGRGRSAPPRSARSPGRCRRRAPPRCRAAPRASARRRRPRAAATQRSAAGEPRLLRHEEVVRRHAHHRRDAARCSIRSSARAASKPRSRITPRALPPREQRLHVPAAAVELRQHLQHDVVGADAGREVEREVRPEAVRVREQRALRLAGRARGVDQEQRIRRPKRDLVTDCHLPARAPGARCASASAASPSSR